MKRDTPPPAALFSVPPNNPRRFVLRIVVWLLAATLCALGLWVLLTAVYISRHVGDEARPAAAIVVFGAAEYAGRPSPVFKARLDHAYDLYQRGLAPVVITTGGFGADPKFSEGGVGRDYLSRRGVPDASLIAETESADTAESADRVAAILRANGWHTVVAVSDAYHLFRVKQFLTRQGVTTYASPRPDSIPKSRVARAEAALREAVSFIFWRIMPMGSR
jgi:uncharacterized SAM-binding protein YcdF (DUF218 family)